MSVHSIKARRRARECSVQFLFGLEFTRYDWREAIEDYWRMNPARPSVKQYAEHTVAGIHAHLEELDSAIAATLENWSPERVGKVERGILRLALFEMRYATDVPAAVAINEAIELARQFGDDDAPRFVNGVLDRLQKRGLDKTPDPVQ